MLGISKDPPAALKRWKEKLGLPFPLLSDEDVEVQKAWGVWKEKSMYGKKVMGTERTTVLVGPDGKVERIFPKVKVEGHVAAVLQAVIDRTGSVVDVSVLRDPGLGIVSPRSERHHQNQRVAGMRTFPGRDS